MLIPHFPFFRERAPALLNSSIPFDPLHLPSRPNPCLQRLRLKFQSPGNEIKTHELEPQPRNLTYFPNSLHFRDGRGHAFSHIPHIWCLLSFPGSPKPHAHHLQLKQQCSLHTPENSFPPNLPIPKPSSNKRDPPRHPIPTAALPILMPLSPPHRPRQHPRPVATNLRPQVP